MDATAAAAESEFDETKERTFGALPPLRDNKISTKHLTPQGGVSFVAPIASISK